MSQGLQPLPRSRPCGQTKAFVWSRYAHRRVRLRLSLSLCLISSLCAPAAFAAEIKYRLNQPAQPLHAALLTLSDTMRLSIGGLDPDKCRAKPVRLKGELTPSGALKRLLADSQCMVEAVGANTWRLKLKPPPPAVPAAPPPPQTVIVVATRSPQRVGTAPASISVLSGTQIAVKDGSLATVAPRVAGLLLTNLGPGRDKMFLRGLTDSILTGRTQSTVGLYLDDSPIIYNAPNPDLLLIDMTSVEVLKGPQGLLYGEGSISGVVRLVTNRPSFSRDRLDIGIGYGETRDGAPSRRQQIISNMILSQDRLAMRLVAYNDHKGGYLHNIANDQRASNTSHREGGRLAVLWQPSKALRIDYSHTRQSINTRDSQYVAGEASTNNGNLTRSVLISEPNKINFLNNALTVEQKFEAGTLKVVLNRLRHKIRTRQDAHTITPYFNTAQNNLIPNNNFIVYDEALNVGLSTQEVNFISAPDRRLKWMVGLYASQMEETFTPQLVDRVSDLRFYDENRLDNMQTSAIFGQLSYEVLPQWTFAIGLRSSRTELKTLSQSRELQLGTLVPEQKSWRNKANNLSHQISLSYRPQRNVNLYLLSADGYRTGGFNTSSLSMTPPVPLTYQGDNLHSVEAGAKLLFDEERLSMRLAGFHLVSEDTQSDQLQTSGLPVTINLGTGNNYGLEFEGDWRLIPGLWLHGAAQFNNASLDQPNTAYITTRDANMPLVAQTSYSLGADWFKPMGQVLMWGSATLAYRGPSSLNFGGREVPVMGGYVTLDLGTTLRVKDTRLSINIDNATNAKGNSFAYGNPFSSSITPQSTPLRPRTVWMMLRMSY